eukprot:1424798-Rhodomonas_salina.1
MATEGVLVTGHSVCVVRDSLIQVTAPRCCVPCVSVLIECGGWTGVLAGGRECGREGEVRVRAGRDQALWLGCSRARKRGTGALDSLALGASVGLC